MDLPRRLIELTAAVGADGGAGVVRALGALFKEGAPYDVGEVAVLGAAGFERWTLTDDDEAVAAEDLLIHVAQRREAIRLDHPGELAAFPGTCEGMTRRRLQSLLALPFWAGSVEGVVVLARRHGWAFVAAPVNAFLYLAAMGGLCLARSQLLTALGRQVEAVKASGAISGPELESLRRELVAAREEGTAARRVAEEDKAALRAELSRAQQDARRLTEDLAGVAARMADAERLRQQLDAALDRERQLVARLTRELESAREGAVRPNADALGHSGRRGRAKAKRAAPQPAESQPAAVEPDPLPPEPAKA